MGRAMIGVGQSKVFHRMFVVAQHRGDSEAALDGIVNQWMTSKAKEIDHECGSGRDAELSLRGNLLSPRLYGYGEENAWSAINRAAEAHDGR